MLFAPPRPSGCEDLGVAGRAAGHSGGGADGLTDDGVT